MEIELFFILIMSYIAAQFLPHPTAAGLISSKIESLHELSGRIDRVIAYEEIVHPPLSKESQATLAGLKGNWTE